MALACVDEDGFSLPVNRLNFFSNPDKVHNGRPTGTVDNNCARRLKETMVRVFKNEFRIKQHLATVRNLVAGTALIIVQRNRRSY